ncbi:MAG: phage holin [Solobacterium sp.]|jgi:phi LC3 family holin|nr:phage holin [Solobacterium sp.]MCH4205277.1 phage holin [Solobacterium sp.]MCH4226870.1 phage holin [Solobacterium sp.]MCH4281630.1 phage holin [Solobacterium sp.]
MINWKVRIKNKSFWLAAVAAALLLIQTVLSLFGYNWDFGCLDKSLASVINALFAFLTVLGVVTDPTTPGVVDSDRALTYTEPGVIGVTESTENKSSDNSDAKSETAEATDHYADSGK